MIRTEDESEVVNSCHYNQTTMRKVILCFLFVVLHCTLWSMTEQDRVSYLKWMQQSLQDVPEWTAWQQKTGELPPDFDLLPRSNLLPDPLKFLDGRPVKNTAADWAARRAEILGLFAKYMLGTFPAKPAIDKVVLLDETPGTGYITRNVRLEFGPAGKVERLPGDGTITRHGSQGIWYERTFVFDASLIQAGTNTLTLTIPASPVNNGLMYDYISLELE